MRLSTCQPDRACSPDRPSQRGAAPPVWPAHRAIGFLVLISLAGWGAIAVTIAAILGG
jgi:hypothetical protein